MIGVDRRVLDPKYERSEYTAGSGLWEDGDLMVEFGPLGAAKSTVSDDSGPKSARQASQTVTF